MPPADADTGAQKSAKQLTAADVAKRFSNVKVRVPKLDKAGKPVVITEGERRGKFDVIERAPTADDVLSFREANGKLIVVFVDGQKQTAAA